jgi:hypothetical protein
VMEGKSAKGALKSITIKMSSTDFANM